MPERKFALIGYPLGHTMSPFIHGRLFALRGEACPYEVLEIPPRELPGRSDLLGGYRGFNVTIPHKRAIIPLLSGLDEKAALYGAVNTVDCRTGTGYNTDAQGFLNALADAGIALAGRVVLCGCGGAARMMAFETLLAGARLTLAVRGSDIPAAEELLAELRKAVSGAQADRCDIGDIRGGVSLLINATPIGMYPHADAMPVRGEVLPNTAAVFDAVYNQKDTLLLQRAAAAGARTAGGMPMLVHQAALAHEIWDGASFTPEDIRALIADADEYMRKHFQKSGDPASGEAV